MVFWDREVYAWVETRVRASKSWATPDAGRL
jgi:hypothetical protein